MADDKIRRYGDFHPFLQREKQFETAINELKTKKQKQSHWIWFLFPTLKSFGESRYSKYFGLYDEEEARLFYENEILRTRLFSLFELVDTLLSTSSIDFIMGSKIDTIKFLSCLDLFFPFVTKETEAKLLHSIRQKLVT